MRSELKYAGKNLSEFGMWFDNSKVYKKPSKRFMGYDIPARNGTLYQSENKFNNVIIEFDCFIKDNFDQNYHDLVNFLNSFDTYQKLVNSYNGNMYRMALFHEAVEVDTGQFLKDGRFKLFFDCKPQEYYADGAEFERIAPHSDIYTGNPAELENEGESSVISLRVALNPVQNLNGYEYPWVGGTGKNKFNPPTTGTNAGVTYTLNSDGTVTVNGTASGYSYKENYITLPVGNYILTGGGNGVNLQIRNRASDAAIAISNTAGASVQFALSASTEVKCRLQVNQGTTLSNLKVYPMIRLASETDASFAPYENICPITGHTQAVVKRTGKNMLPSISATRTMQGVTFTARSDGSVTVDGTNTGNTSAYIILAGPSSLPRNMLLNKEITISGGKNGAYVNNWNYNGQSGSRTSSNGGETTYTFTNADADYNFAVAVNPGVTVNNVTVYPMVRPAGTSAEFEPYTGQTYTINLNGTRYGGTVDLATGVLTVTDANIASYNGETLPSTWISDRNVYASGTTPTTGAQVVYKLATPQTVQLTPQQISLLTGINYISSSDEVTVTTRTPLILKNPSPMTAKPVFKFNNITAPFTVSANGETIISFQNAIRLIKYAVANNMTFNANGTNLIMQKQGTPNYEETSFLINSGWLPAGRYYLATMPIGNLEVTSMDGRHLYSSGGTFTLTDMTQVKVWYVITPDASTPQNFNFPIFLRPLGTLYVDSELMDCYMLDGDTAYSFNECVNLPKDFLQLDERTVMTMTSGAVGFIAPNWWRL